MFRYELSDGEVIRVLCDLNEEYESGYFIVKGNSYRQVDKPNAHLAVPWCTLGLIPTPVHPTKKPFVEWLIMMNASKTRYSQ